jgi:hypothetical protein
VAVIELVLVTVVSGKRYAPDAKEWLTWRLLFGLRHRPGTWRDKDGIPKVPSGARQIGAETGKGSNTWTAARD